MARYMVTQDSVNPDDRRDKEVFKSDPLSQSEALKKFEEIKDNDLSPDLTFTYLWKQESGEDGFWEVEKHYHNRKIELKEE